MDKKKKIIALVVTVALFGIIFYRLDWADLIMTFNGFDCKNLAQIVPFYVLTLYFRGIRWKALLLENSKYSTLNLGQIFTVGSMLNSFLPARAGDIYRAYYLGTVKNEKKMKIFGTIILERLLDGICMFLIFLSAILLYFKQAWILHLAYAIGALFVGSLIIFYLLFKFNKMNVICQNLISWANHLPQELATKVKNAIEKLTEFFNSFIEGFEVLGNWRCTFIAFFTSFVIWGIECYVAYLIVDSFDLGLRFAAGLFVISLISFSTMIPSTSMFLGPYQYAYILALGIFNISKSTALAVSAVHQTILMIILTVIGGYYFLKFNMKIDKNITNLR